MSDKLSQMSNDQIHVLESIMNDIYGEDHPTKGNGGYKEVCHWCGEPAIETITLSESDSTGYVDRIEICHDPACLERTRKVIKFRRGHD